MTFQSVWHDLYDYQYDAISSYYPHTIQPFTGIRRLGDHAKHETRQNGTYYYPWRTRRKLRPGHWSTPAKDNIDFWNGRAKPEVKEWLKERRIKWHQEWLWEDDELKQIFIFKNSRVAVLFKLVWG